MTPTLTLDHVTKTYRRGDQTVTALADVAFSASSGQFVGIVGPSGSGKTTLLNLIASLDRPDHGTIRLDDLDITTLTRRAAARYRNTRVGVVFQAYNLLPQLTALENVLVPMIPTRRLDRTRAHRLLTAVGLADRTRHRPSQLSGGEQQRVAVARALANDPDVVIADEPTGNLDRDAATTVLDLLVATCRNQHHTLLLATHDPDTLTKANQILTLDHGRLA